jgi:spermidine synthase
MTRSIQLSVFLAGFGVMAAEMVAPRLLAPAFGTSQLVWTNVIGTILVALTVGAWIGGRLADRAPSERAFGFVLMSGGLLVASVPVASRPILRSAMAALSQQDTATYLVSLGAVSLLFAPPVLLFAMASPFAVRLAAAGRTDLGRVAGSLSALAALGSIAGTFGASLVLLPLLGSRSTLLGMGALIAAVGATQVFRARGRAVVALFFVALAALGRGPIRSDAGQIFETESLYHYIQVQRDAQGSTRLLLDESVSLQSLLPESKILTGGVWDYLAFAPTLAHRGGRELRVLLVGLAGGTVAHQIAAAYGGEALVRIHGIELDPAILEVGRRYLALDSVPGLTVEVADARVAVERLREQFHVIVVDVFHGLYIPAHLVTEEFFEACRRRLEPGGVLAMNLATPKDSGRLLGAVVGTLEQVFQDVRYVRLPANAPVENVVLFASDATVESPPRGSTPPELRTLGVEPQPVDVPARYRRVLTDDHAPVEWLTDLALLEALVSPPVER